MLQKDESAQRGMTILLQKDESAQPETGFDGKKTCRPIRVHAEEIIFQFVVTALAASLASAAKSALKPFYPFSFKPTPAEQPHRPAKRCHL
ncbi:MAG: hypothetical protein H6632_21100 [Anaerolineales bacterium]|nr:hypothetical protein [Anaerolineales bacterium]